MEEMRIWNKGDGWKGVDGNCNFSGKYNAITLYNWNININSLANRVTLQIQNKKVLSMYFKTR